MVPYRKIAARNYVRTLTLIFVPFLRLAFPCFLQFLLVDIQEPRLTFIGKNLKCFHHAVSDVNKLFCKSVGYKTLFLSIAEKEWSPWFILVRWT